ncbi:MAG: lysozyme inhibitor LprI family protein [Pseudomonadota bacterium]
MRPILMFAAGAAFLILAGLMGPNDARAQSFNCNNASTPVESIICNEPYLGALDEEMASLYFSIRNTSGSRTRSLLQEDQRNWLRLRNNCGYDYFCVERAYQVRINELRTIY